MIMIPETRWKCSRGDTEDHYALCGAQMLPKK
jgi:hypothetical protein